ncbi:ATPase assembly factor ATP10 [Phytophthora cactorum]|nr:ATPase assembly factor ATP10 [Phytophthora cactorum]
MLPSRRATSALRRCRAPLGASFSSSPDVSKNQNAPLAAAGGSAKPKKILSVRASPAQNLRNALEALDEMIEEADRKVEKKYRPNMFAEFKQLNDTEGKVLEGSETFIEVGNAKSVPSLKVDTLDGKQVDVQSFVTKGKVTLVLTAFKNYGLDMLPAWRDGFVAAFGDKQGQLDSRLQTLTLNVIEDWYMKLVSGSITRGLQEKIPKELHATTFAHFGRCDDFRTPMALDNSFVGYAHLVDGKGRIRWIAGGPATPKELDRLAKVTKQLLAQSAQHRRR